MAQTPKFDGSKVHYTSDLHLFHRNIPKYQRATRFDDQGPFLTFQGYDDQGEEIWQATDADIDRMHLAIINNWNRKVAEDDIVFLPGDLAMGGRSKAEQVQHIVDNCLNGRKIAQPGNHDDYTLDIPFKTLEWTDSIYEIRVSGQLVVLCHYPLLIWHRNNRGAWNLHGHSHHSLAVDTRYKRYDVGIDGPWGFRPVSHNEMVEIMAGHSQEALDHHY